MSNFLSNLAQRGAGLEPAPAVQPAITSYFAAEPGAPHATWPEGQPASEAPLAPPRAGEPAIAPARAPLVEGPGPPHPAQSSLARPRSDDPVATASSVATDRERGSRPDGADESEPTPGPSSGLEQASPPATSRTEVPPPPRSTSAAEVEAGPARPQASARVVPQTRGTPRIEESHQPERVVDGRSEAEIPEIPPPGRPSGSRPPARPTPVRPVDRSRISPRVSAEVEAFPVETPVIVEQLRVIRQATARSLASDLPEKRDATRPVQVRIGTIEVRANTPPVTPPPAPRPAAPVPGGFEDYAMIRSYTGWERS
jgi:hypothetical protein